MTELWESIKERVNSFVETGRAHASAVAQPLFDAAADRGSCVVKIAFTEARVLYFVAAETVAPHMEQASSIAQSKAEQSFNAVRPFVESNFGSLRKTLFGEPPPKET